MMSVRAVRNEGVTGISSGVGVHHAQEPMRPSKAPEGTGGTAGCPEHQDPEQGRLDGGVGIGSARPVRSLSKGSISEGRRAGSFLERTRWEQPASAAEGASRTSARSVGAAPDHEKDRCQGGRDLVIRRASWSISPRPKRQGQDAGEMRRRLENDDESRLDSIRLQVVCHFFGRAGEDRGSDATS